MKAKFLVIADETPESRIAMRFACREAMKTQSNLALMVVIEPEGFQHWLGVESIMKEEAQAAASDMLKTLAAEARDISGIQPELVIREGSKKEQLLVYLSETQDFVILVLGAAMGAEGPGPLVSGLFADKNERLSVPVTIVPGSLTDEQIEVFS
ncbi:MAG: universal stress protein [Hyphomicrobiales bacterium]|nr:universal stress protein [Hyphomicrobiales bacterium]MCY4039593.1 universal stress protein [Hyphomicrobiales bacterium]